MARNLNSGTLILPTVVSAGMPSPFILFFSCAAVLHLPIQICNSFPLFLLKHDDVISFLLRSKQSEENISLVLSPNLTTYYHLYPPYSCLLPSCHSWSMLSRFFAFCCIISLSIQTCYYLFHIKYFFSIWQMLPISLFFLEAKFKRAISISYLSFSILH